MIFFSLPGPEEADPKRQLSSQAEDLLLRMADGDQEALAQLYGLTKAAVYGFALSILGNRQDAEDVMQDAYLRIYASAGGYRPQGKAMAWILTIVRNAALMKLREAKKRPDSLEDRWDAADPRDDASRSLDRMALEAAMTVLSQEERQIVLLYGLSGLLHREIAALLDLPLSTVLSKYRRALSKLRKQLPGGKTG